MLRLIYARFGAQDIFINHKLHLFFKFHLFNSVIDVQLFLYLILSFFVIHLQIIYKHFYEIGPFDCLNSFIKYYRGCNLLQYYNLLILLYVHVISKV